MLRKYFKLTPQKQKSDLPNNKFPSGFAELNHEVQPETFRRIQSSHSQILRQITDPPIYVSNFRPSIRFWFDYIY